MPLYFVPNTCPCREKCPHLLLGAKVEGFKQMGFVHLNKPLYLKLTSKNLLPGFPEKGEEDEEGTYLRTLAVSSFPSGRCLL